MGAVVPLRAVLRDPRLGGVLEPQRHGLPVSLAARPHHRGSGDLLGAFRAPAVVPLPLSHRRDERVVCQALDDRSALPPGRLLRHLHNLLVLQGRASHPSAGDGEPRLPALQPPRAAAGQQGLRSVHGVHQGLPPRERPVQSPAAWRRPLAGPRGEPPRGQPDVPLARGSVPSLLAGHLHGAGHRRGLDRGRPWAAHRGLGAPPRHPGAERVALGRCVSPRGPVLRQGVPRSEVGGAGIRVAAGRLGVHAGLLLPVPHGRGREAAPCGGVDRRARFPVAASGRGSASGHRLCPGDPPDRW
mmetsp:Transcript_33315/g.79012  ORF Transcript_33315/g.79012 Transcript_33315/m.79012 type:complete len:300 (-) Transcript_33315:414-1313(-)